MVEKKNMYLIISIIFTFFILYIIFLLLLSVIDRKLTGIKINIPKQDVVLGIDRLKMNNQENFTNKNDYQKNYQNNNYNHVLKKKDLNFETDYLNGVQGYSEYETEPYYLNDSLTKFKVDHNDEDDVCYKKHVHNSEDKECSYGRTNYPNPATMNAMDRKIFKTYYQDGMTLQDYVNWLYMHEEDKNNLKLEYDHIKYYKAIRKGQRLKYIRGVCPPSAKSTNKPRDSAEFYQNLYNEDINNEIKKSKCSNINFSQLFNQSGMDARSPLDVKLVEDASNTHLKSINPSNYLNYMSADNFNSNPYQKGKMDAKSLELMVRAKSSTPISNKFIRGIN